MKIDLREYQGDAVQQARELIRQGARNVLICAPTGAGKTVIASHLIDESQAKGRRSAFVVDRKSLIDQTSTTFDRYGIDHGIIQADHWRFKPDRQVQICSIQTVARRQWPRADLIVVDEAHTITETVKKRITPRDTVTVGLTATPFTKGLGQLYDAIVNVTTTNRLIEQGFLSKYRIFACAEPDMNGVKVVAGEWERKETQKRALEVVGDVVQEYLKHGEGRKFICSAVDTAHVEDLQRQFLAAGINCATYTYKDLDEDRADTVTEFRKADSTIRGLITVTAASKGFDVADIGVVIMARPLRKSLAEHIQFFGRGLRIADGKDDCIVLDHSGNCARFWQDMQDFFENGITELDDGKKKDKPKPKEKAEAEPVTCPTCRHIHKPMPFCPSCGFEYPKRAAVQHVPGTLKELIAHGDQTVLRKKLWPQICWIVRHERNARDDLHAQRMAQAIYASMTGTTAKARIELTDLVEPTTEVRNKIRADQIRWAKGREKSQQAVPA
jgi:superfamily II DNA or RNA helicase